MSAVTFETLLADYQAAKLAMYEHRALARALPFDDWQDEQRRLRKLAQDAGHLCDIAARYQDDQEGLRAAMLYKLSDGAIDPRKL